MSMTHHSNRGITLTSLADLGTVLDAQTLPSGPETPAEADETRESAPDSCPPVPQDLAGLIAQLASLSGGLESMAREDARAREQASIELAQYETLLAERQGRRVGARGGAPVAGRCRAAGCGGLHGRRPCPGCPACRHRTGGRTGLCAAAGRADPCCRGARRPPPSGARPGRAPPAGTGSRRKPRSGLKPSVPAGWSAVLPPCVRPSALTVWTRPSGVPSYLMAHLPAVTPPSLLSKMPSMLPCSPDRLTITVVMCL